jgi:hypothetical protein
MMLSLDTVRLRFKVLGPSALTLYPITLDKGSQDIAVSRDFMAAEYSGSIRSTCPNIAKHHLEKHGMDDFMYFSSQSSTCCSTSTRRMWFIHGDKHNWAFMAFIAAGVHEDRI